jgi:hypothetical protein
MTLPQSQRLLASMVLLPTGIVGGDMLVRGKINGPAVLGFVVAKVRVVAPIPEAALGDTNFCTFAEEYNFVLLENLPPLPYHALGIGILWYSFCPSHVCIP